MPSRECFTQNPIDCYSRWCNVVDNVGRWCNVDNKNFNKIY